jgi:hypothetical protein
LYDIPMAAEWCLGDTKLSQRSEKGEKMAIRPNVEAAIKILITVKLRRDARMAKESKERPVPKTNVG